MTLQQLRYVVEVAKHKSMNKAAAELFISQPSLSNAIKDLEKEIHISIFSRSNRGIVPTPEGEEFLGYARQMLEQYQLIEQRYIESDSFKKKFSVSTQHYTFAVEAFIALARSFGMDKYEFAIHETKTKDVIENVRLRKSEVGIIYKNDFNDKFISKILREADLEFCPLFECHLYVFMSRFHPLSKKERIDFEELQPYPCLSFEQGDSNSFYFAEEVLSTADYPRIIKADDRATFLNLMLGLNAYTLCSGIICQELNGEEYLAVPLNSSETMNIGYIKQKKVPLSKVGAKYVEELKKYREKAM